ncbi:tyrosine-type recombinase/integrase [Streptomyces sp. NPDC056690]|uniref:tyrosine-type recombinase/integrase n=1 Tax=unclassified Streptomyces TaxID=2593676 RepID=UPI0036272DF6
MWNANHWKRALWHAGIIEAPEKRPRKTGTGAHLAYGAQPEYGFHSLRHTFASVQLDSRENPVAVSKWLGHADAAITLRIYGHFMPDADGRGRQAIDAWFDGSTESSPDAPQETVEPRSVPALTPAEEGETASLGLLDTAPDVGEPAA